MMKSEGASRLVAEVAQAERAERTRLADRLHDEALQLALAARQELQELRDGDPAALEALQEDLDRVAVALRSLTSAMHEDVLERLPLAEGLRRIAADAERRGRFTARLEVDHGATGVHDHLVRDVVRELLDNAARHAHASKVVVGVLRDGVDIVVRVADDGRGIDERARAEALRAGHLGLGRLERTALELGGRLELEGRGGTEVTVRLPVSVLAAQRSLEDVLGDERRWSSALLTVLQDGLIVVRNGAVVRVNDAFCTMTGFSREQLLGARAPALPFWAPEDRTVLMDAMNYAFDRGGAEQELELLAADGRKLAVLASSARLDPGHEAEDERAMVVAFKDLSERRRAEERTRLEAELLTSVSTTQRMNEVVGCVDEGPEALLEALGRLFVEHLGWTDAVINLRDDEDGGWRVAWTSSPVLAEALEGAVYADEDWAPFLDRRFARRGASFVPAEAEQPGPGHHHGQPWPPLDGPDAWQPEDVLLVPMRSGVGRLLGLVTVDRPRRGRRPTDTELDLLVAAAELGARCLVLARRAALQGALRDGSSLPRSSVGAGPSPS